MASILGLCESHLSVESEAAAHYRNVCRALVSEALELSFFLKKTLVRAEEHSEELQQLALKDWVSFENQLIFTNFLKKVVKWDLFL